MDVKVYREYFEVSEWIVLVDNSSSSIVIVLHKDATLAQSTN